MTTSRLRAAIIGTGFMGRVHCEALRRLGAVDVAAVAGSHIDKARAFADAHGVDRAANDYRAVIADRAVDTIRLLDAILASHQRRGWVDVRG